MWLNKYECVVAYHMQWGQNKDFTCSSLFMIVLDRYKVGIFSTWQHTKVFERRQTSLHHDVIWCTDYNSLNVKNELLLTCELPHLCIYGICSIISAVYIHLFALIGNNVLSSAQIAFTHMVNADRQRAQPLPSLSLSLSLAMVSPFVSLHSPLTCHWRRQSKLKWVVY